MENNTVQLNEISLLFVANENDYKKKIEIVGFFLFKNKERVDVNFRAIEARINLLAENEPFVLFFHLNVDKLTTFAPELLGMIDDLKGKYPNFKPYYNTSHKKDLTPKDLNDALPGFDEHELFGNNDITKNIEKGKIKIQTKKEIISSKAINEPISDQKQISIFLSHSSKDNDIMLDFKEMLLEKGLQVPAANIFYSSERVSGVPTSKDIPDILYEEIKNKVLFIRFVSKNYNESVVCHNEYGAVWYKNQNELEKIITLKEKDLPYNEIGFLDKQRLFVKIEDETALRQFREDNKKYFPQSRDNDWEKKMKDFLNKYFS